MLLLSISLTAQLPESIDYRGELPPVMDQGKNGNCLAMAVSVMMTWKGSSEYTPQFIYNNRQDSNELDMGDIKRILNIKAISVKRIEELKTALSQNGPCIINFQIYNHATTIWKPIDSRRVAGMHSMLVVGYNLDGFILRNSWGTDWGDNGYCIFPYDDWKWKWEVWTFID